MMIRSIIQWAAFLLLLSPAGIAAFNNVHYGNFLFFLGLITLAAILVPAALLLLRSNGAAGEARRNPDAS
jgi:hypothetical protein